MKTRVWLSVLIVFSLMSALPIRPVTSAKASADTDQTAASGNYPYLRVLESSAAGMRILFEPPQPQINSTVVSGAPCQQVQIEGLLPTSDLDLPPLPVQGVMLGIPAESQPALTILAEKTTLLTGAYQLCPQELPIAESKLKEMGVRTESPLSLSARQDVFLPLETAQIIETGFIRSQPYLQLRLNPVQYNPRTGELRFVSRLEFAVDFGATAAAQGTAHQVADEGEFEQELQQALLNYKQAIQWRMLPARSAAPASSVSYTGTFYKVEVSQDGITSLTYEYLQTAGLPVGTIDPNTFQLFDRGIPVAMRQLDDGDVLFESGESLLFYGRTLNGPFGKTNVYWLTWGGEPGLRMRVQSGAPGAGYPVPPTFRTTSHFEQNKTYYSNKASGDRSDHWYWGTVFNNSALAQRQFKVNLGVLPAAGSATMTVSGLLRGYIGVPFNRAKVFLNGTLLGSADLTMNTWVVFSFQNVPQSLLLQGENIIEIQTPLEDGLTTNAVAVNWFEITYNDAYTAESDQLWFDGDQAGSWRYQVDGFSAASVEAYDISDPISPVILSDFGIEASPNGQKLTFEAATAGETRYLAQTTAKRLMPASVALDVPSSWGSAENTADYIVLSHANFMTQAQTLANFRGTQGFRTAVINVQDVYDEFNDGEFSPQAIQDFLKFAYANWAAPKPAYLVLLGDGHFDYFNNFGYGETNYIPAFIVDVDPFQGEVAADNRYALVSGADILPDLRVGRLPARNTNEAAAMVQKIVDYETNEPVGWNANLTFVADNADDGGQYAADTDALISSYLPASYSAEKIYFGITHATAAAVKTALKAAVNAGRLVVHYAGHSGIQKWGDEGFFNLTDIASLTNAAKLPLVLPMTCLEGNFSYPSPASNLNLRASMGESIVRKLSGGAIASWSPTGLGLHSGHMILETKLLDNLFTRYYNQIGFLTTDAKYGLFAVTSGYRDLIDSYVLFGDPALRLQTIPVPLESPSDLTAAVTSWDKIALNWTDNSTSETSFRIERSPDGSTGWQQVAQVSANVTSFTDTGLSELTTYYYRVLAFREADLAVSAYTNTASAATLSYLRAPSALAAAALSWDRIKLDWTDNSNSETSFRIQRSPDGSTGWQQVAEVGANVTSFTDTGLTAFTSYFYRVSAYRLVDNLDSEFSSTAAAATLTRLSAPTGLSVSMVSDTWLTLLWQETNADESALLVERSLDDMVWQQIAELGPDATSYTDTGLTPLTTYHYQVRAYRAFDNLNSDYSSSVTTATLSPLGAPSDLTAAAASWDKIALNWTDNSTSETSFRIERSPDGSTGWQQVAEVSADITSFTDTGLSELTIYYYRVLAYRETDLAVSTYTNTAAAETLSYLSAPSALAANAVCNGSVLLSWQDNSIDESAFRLERSLGSETNWELLAALGAGTTAYQDVLQPGSFGYYRVRAYRETDQMVSDYSNTIFAVMNYCLFLPQIVGGTP